MQIKMKITVMHNTEIETTRSEQALVRAGRVKRFRGRSGFGTNDICGCEYLAGGDSDVKMVSPTPPPTPNPNPPDEDDDCVFGFPTSWMVH